MDTKIQIEKEMLLNIWVSISLFFDWLFVPFKYGLCASREWRCFWSNLLWWVVFALFLCGCGSEGNFDFLWGFLTGPYFRISSSSFCSMRGCGWNLPEAQRYAEKTVRFTGRFSVIQHTCYSKVITDARWGLMRNGLVHTATEGQTHRGPLGAYWACAARQEAGVGLLSMACVCSHHSSHAMAHSAFRKRFGGGDAALTVCSEAGTPHWSVFVCCVIRESEVLKKSKALSLLHRAGGEQIVLKPPPSSPPQAWVWSGSPSQIPTPTTPSNQNHHSRGL